MFRKFVSQAGKGLFLISHFGYLTFISWFDACRTRLVQRKGGRREKERERDRDGDRDRKRVREKEKREGRRRGESVCMWERGAASPVLSIDICGSLSAGLSM